METNKKSIEQLLGSVEDYGKTGIELLILKFVEKSSGILSKLIAYFILIVTLSFFLILFSVGVAFLIGDMLGAAFYGFLIVAAFYGLLGLTIVIFLPKISDRIKNSIISQMLN